jgi:acetyl esterase/lipase
MSARGIDVVRAHLAKIPPATTVAKKRAQYDRAERAFPVPPDVAIKSVQVPGAAEWLEPPSARAGAAVLYLHGGGYVIGSPRSHRHLAAAIGRAARASVLLPDYRLAPSTRSRPRWTTRWPRTGGSWTGQAPARTVLAGDSAGGGLAVATLLALRERGLPLPAAGVCISPWVDLTFSGGSYATKAASDPIVTREGVTEMARAYVGQGDPRVPLVSPLFADLRGLPPLLIHVGSDEVLLDDAVQLAERAKAAGVDATLEIYERMIHVWHWFLPMLDEAQTAVETIGRFVRSRA